MTKGTHVTWKQLIFLAVIITGVLSVLWTEIRSNGRDDVERGKIIVEVRNDVKWIKGLIQDAGEITFRSNGK